MKVIIAGSRSFSDYTLLEKKCNNILGNKLPDVTIISGNARGADTLGITYAKNNGLDVEIYPAQWSKDGRRAGYIRNGKMAKLADGLIAFWDGKSPGTRHMIDLMKKAGKPVRVIRY